MPKSYESIKIYDDDYRRAEEIRQQRGTAIIDAVGAALEGWKHLPRRVQDRVISERMRRRTAKVA